jgi:hypothetical protein
MILSRPSSISRVALRVSAPSLVHWTIPENHRHRVLYHSLFPSLLPFPADGMVSGRLFGNREQK